MTNEEGSALPATQSIQALGVSPGDGQAPPPDSQAPAPAQRDAAHPVRGKDWDDGEDHGDCA